jgi:hypothetical protein
MRQYQIPQFITVEDKVIGPLTIKQALYVGGGGLLIVGIRMAFEPYLSYPFSVITGAFAAALAFLKINERPFPVVLKNAIFYLFRPRLYIWKKSEEKKPQEKEPGAQEAALTIKSIPKMSESKLSDLAWSLDIKEKIR